MKINVQGDTLRVSGVKELSAANSSAFRDWVRGNIGAELKNIEIDLSEAGFIDSSGLGALVSLHRTASGRKGNLKLINPLPPVQQILELTRMHRIFEIMKA
jgi:anti-sigma B factor antagonist